MSTVWTDYDKTDQVVEYDVATQSYDDANRTYDGILYTAWSGVADNVVDWTPLVPSENLEYDDAVDTWDSATDTWDGAGLTSWTKVT